MRTVAPVVKFPSTPIPVAMATEITSSSEMKWCRDNLQSLIAAQIAEKQRKVAGEKAKKVAAEAGKLVLDFQKKFGDSKATLERLAAKIQANVSTLYRWRRVAEGKPARKTEQSEVFFVIRFNDGKFYSESIGSCEFVHASRYATGESAKSARTSAGEVVKVTCRLSVQKDSA
jgi:hypothetical protein